MVNLDLTALTSTELDRYIRSGEIVVLVGSGISNWEPTTLPTGQDFAAGVRDALFSTPGHPIVALNDLNFLEDHLKNIPFEMIMERCPDPIIVSNLLANLYSGPSSNDIHKAISDLVKSGKIHSIITTNYDLGIDNVLTGSPLTKIVNESDASHAGSRVYFKIHGCASDPKSLIFSLKQESELPTWKKNILKNVLTGKPLVLIGYSGFDFEICPELPRSNPSTILWNFYSDEDKKRSPGLKHILSLGIPKYSLLGDMCKLFSLLGRTVNPSYASGGLYNIGDELRRLFTDDALLLWRVRVLVTIGHARLAIQSLQPLLIRHPVNPDITCEFAQALFHNGQYSTSAQQHLFAATNAPDQHNILYRQLDACDALRCYGNFKEAWRILKLVTSNLKMMSPSSQEIVVRALLKEMLLIRNRWQYRKKFFIGFGCHSLRERAKYLIQNAAPLALEEGLWLDFQQLQLWADRFQFPAGTLSARGGYEPLSTLDGYNHLGYYIPRLMHLYDKLFDDNISVSHDEVENAFDSAAQMACHPVAWKLARGAEARFQNQSSQWNKKFKKHLSACQYTLPQRLAFRVAWPI